MNIVTNFLIQAKAAEEFELQLRQLKNIVDKNKTQELLLKWHEESKHQALLSEFDYIQNKISELYKKCST